MNLIEQLGGYECAKAEYSDPMYEDGELYTIKATGTRFFKHNLAEELIEYRRQHKIYEVGDLVVKCGSIHQKSTSFSLWQVLLVLQTSIPCIEVAPLSKKGKVIHAGKSIQVLQQFRHAEPEELEAGKRLGVV